MAALEFPGHRNDWLIAYNYFQPQISHRTTKPIVIATHYVISQIVPIFPRSVTKGLMIATVCLFATRAGKKAYGLPSRISSWILYLKKQFHFHFSFLHWRRRNVLQVSPHGSISCWTVGSFCQIQSEKMPVVNELKIEPAIVSWNILHHQSWCPKPRFHVLHFLNVTMDEKWSERRQIVHDSIMWKFRKDVVVE